MQKLKKEREKAAQTANWTTVYDEEFPDTAGYNCIRIILDQHKTDRCLFLHILKDNEEDPTETVHVYSSINSLVEHDNEETSFPFDKEHYDRFIHTLNALKDPDNYCGDDSELRNL